MPPGMPQGNPTRGDRAGVDRMSEQMAYVGLGSNVGDRLDNLRTAAQMLSRGGSRVTVASSVYETEPVGYADQDWFLNAVVGAEVALGVHEFHALLKRIEVQMGRKSRHRWGPREIDLDLLLFGDEIVNEARLVMPHARMHERGFVMQPIAEIASETTHPVIGRSMGRILATLNDPAEVRRVHPPSAVFAASQEEREA